MSLQTMQTIAETYVLGSILLALFTYLAWERKFGELAVATLGFLLYAFWTIGAALIVILIIGSIVQ